MISARVTSILLTAALVRAPLVQAAEVGPTKGALVVVGGNMQDERIVKRFIDLAGGPDSPIVVIPTAGGAENYDQSWQGLRQFKDTGAKNLSVLHTYERAVADTEKFVEPLTHARGVFFDGGRQWRLADAYLNTLTHGELQNLLIVAA
jgi:cyanophycinase-like exopeptidase